MTIGAKINTEVTFLAEFFVYLDMTFHITSPKQFNAYDSIDLAHAFLLINKRKSSIFEITNYETQITRRFSPGIIPNSQSLLDSSISKIQFTLFLNFESHYH